MFGTWIRSCDCSRTTGAAQARNQEDYVQEINEITERIIGLAIEVHRHLGPGIAEAGYERALVIELMAAGMAFERQIGIPVIYKGSVVAEYRPDLVVSGRVVVEIKSVERLTRVHTAQMLTYLRVTKRELGLILNFNEAVLKDGIRRVALQRDQRLASGSTGRPSGGVEAAEETAEEVLRETITGTQRRRDSENF